MSGSVAPFRASLAVLLLLCCGCSAGTRSPHPPQSELLPCNDNNCLRVLSWNLHGLPCKSNTPKRLQQVASVIADQQPDLVLLQEVWFGGYKRLLRCALKPDYEMVYDPHWVTRWPRGGLVMFVRYGSAWRASGDAFRPYDASAPWYRVKEMDGLAGKGILAVKIASGKASLVVVDTHLQSPYAGHSYRAERQAQMEELSTFLQNEYPDTPVLIGGDFNTATCEPLYESHLSKLGDDLTRHKRQSCECGTHFDDCGGRQEWIDYVFARNWKVDAEVTLIQNDFVDSPYSDHDGLLVRLVYDGASLKAPGCRSDCD